MQRSSECRQLKQDNNGHRVSSAFAGATVAAVTPRGAAACVALVRLRMSRVTLSFHLIYDDDYYYYYYCI